MSDRAEPLGSEGLLAQAGRLRALAAQLVSDPAQADDVLQETWLAALRRPPATDRPLEPWFARVARNFARRQRRAASRRAEHEQQAEAPRELPGPERTAERLESQRLLLEEVSALDEPLRTTVTLRYFDELSGADIARLQGVPEGTVRWRLKRALDLLRERLDARFDGERAGWYALFLAWGAPGATLPIPPLSTPPSPPLSPAGSLGTGILLMSATSKVALVLAVTTLAGVAWIGLRSEPRPEGGARVVTTPGPTARSEAPMEPTRPESPVQEESRAPLAPRPVRAAASVPETAAAPTPEPEHLVDARFVDATGAPWPGVRLGLAEDESLWAESGPDGRATLSLRGPTAPRSARHMDFLACRRGCAAVTLGATVHPGEATHLGDVVLVGALAVRGRVLDEEGQPLAGAEVGLGGVNLGDDDVEFVARQGTEAFDVGAKEHTDARGEFELGAVAPGTWRLWAHAKDTRYAWTEPFEVDDRDVEALELVLPRWRASDRLLGRVVDPEGHGVPKARLFYGYETETESGTSGVVADDEGRFDFLIRRSAPHTILASDPEHRWSDASAEEVTPGAGEITITLGSPRRIEVRVRDMDGQPIAEPILVLNRPDPGFQVNGMPETIAAGHLSFLLPSFPVELLVSAPGFRTRELGPFSADDAPDSLEAVLQPLPTIRGRVLADGRPLAGVRVGLHPAIAGGLIVDGLRCVMEPSPAFEARTAEDGTFVLNCEVRDDVWVRAEAEGWAGADLGPLPPGGGEPIELRLTHGGAIEGRVQLADGSNPEGAIVAINHGDGRGRTARAGPNGFYRFEGLAPGAWQVHRVQSEIRPDTRITYGDRSRDPIQWDCRVVAGETTVFDVIE